MNNDLDTIMASLQRERGTLAEQITAAHKSLQTLKSARQQAARDCVNKLVPNLNEITLATLRREVPRLIIPTVPRWHMLSRKLDPTLTVDQLRMKLGTLLDTLSVREQPELWRTLVAPTDVRITELTESRIELALRVKALDEQILNLETLRSSNLSRLPEVARLDLAEKTKAVVLRIQQTPSSPSGVTPRTGMGTGSDVTDFLVGWLYWSLILDDQTYVDPSVSSCAAAPLTYAHKELGGNSAVSDAATPTRDEQLAVQEGLGSQSFS
jgi:hypothetical protein